jgi:hypothetical protein
MCGSVCGNVPRTQVFLFPAEFKGCRYHMAQFVVQTHAWRGAREFSECFVDKLAEEVLIHIASIF